MNNILEKYCRIFNLDLTDKSRIRTLVWARYAMFFDLSEKGLRYKEISKILGFNRTTVFHGIRQFEYMMKHGDPIAVEYWDKIIRDNRK